jgi:hypothetical protein
MPEYVPTRRDPGVPYRRPVEPVKLAQAGLFTIENVSVAPSGSLAVGLNEYDLPTVAEPDGAPRMVGAAFDPTTSIENGGSEALAWPSLTLITMFG